MTVHTARIGDIVSGRAPDILEALALGSCVAAVIYDPENKIGALAHILLPSSSNFSENNKIGKYADTAIPETIKLATRKGANKERLKAKIAGGAKMFKMPNNGNKRIDIGARNVKAVKDALRNAQIPIVGDDTGDTYGRTIRFNLEKGLMEIKMGLKKTTKHI